MMRRVNIILMLVCCISSVQGGYEYADRVIGPGEYVYEGVTWLSGVLVIDGGGGTPIEVRNYSRVEVWSTSTPLGYHGGIMDLVILNSRLDYYGGLTEELAIGGQHATAHLYGGRIDFISSAQYVSWVNGEPTGQHIFIYAKDGWEWKRDENGVIRGITGLWLDSGNPFDIRFTTRFQPGYDPVWANVKVIPEPATLLLICLGTFLLHRRRG